MCIGPASSSSLSPVAITDASVTIDVTTATANAATTVVATRKSDLLLVTRVPKFLRCLYDILHSEDPSILAWSSDGSCFQIFSTKCLEERVLPKYFKHSKFASFQRQLNNFGFRKWTKTQSSVCTFSHHVFVQRHPSELVVLVIAQNEASHQQQLEQAAQDEADEAMMITQARASVTACNTVSFKKTSTATKKRKRSPDAVDSSSVSLQPFKLHHTGAMFYDATNGKELSFQEQLSFNVEYGDLMPISNLVETHQSLLHHTHHRHHSHTFKHELGNETPTSAAALNELTFNFTMEELDDILFTTSEPEQQQYECYASMTDFVF